MRDLKSWLIGFVAYLVANPLQATQTTEVQRNKENERSNS